MRQLEVVEIAHVGGGDGGSMEDEYGSGPEGQICGFEWGDPSESSFTCTFSDGSTFSIGTDAALGGFGGGWLATIGRMVGRSVTSGASDAGYGGSLAGLEGWGSTFGGP